MQRLRYFLLVFFFTSVSCSGCSDAVFSDNERCIRPNNPLKIQRQVSGDQTYTCSDNFIDFTCTKEGRFPDLADTSCTWYFECIKDSRGVFLHKYVQCLTFKFSPTLQACSSTYECPCDVVAVPPPTPEPNWWCTNTTIPKFRCEKVGRFPDLRDNTCSQYFLCSKFHNATWVKTSYTCKNSNFDPDYGKCRVDYACPCSTPTTLSTTIAPTTPQDYLCSPTGYVTKFHCKEIGRHPDLDDPKCQQYFLCSKLRNETWIKTRYACSGNGSNFDPKLQKCSIHYTCPCDVTTTTEHATTNAKITATTTSSGCIPVTTPFECSNKGRFPDLADVWCKNYFLCSQLRNGTWLRTNYTCSGSAFFDPSTGGCSSEYTCPCANEPTTSIQVETTTPVAPTTLNNCSPNVPDFECTTKGRFPDLSDFECQKYFLCSQYKNSTWVRKSYRCTQSKFDPKMQKCSVTYMCPCSLPTTEPTLETTISTQTTTLSTPTTVSTSTSSTCAPPSKPLPDFRCKKVGRFPDLADPYCKKYYLCSQLRNGSWRRTRYSCKDSVFAPESQICHVSYRCPCLSYYTTPVYMGGL